MLRKYVIPIIVLSLFALFSCEECEPCPTAADNNSPSTPVITASATTVESGGQVDLTATSTDEDGDTITYLWDATGGSYNPPSSSTVVWTAPTVDNDQTFTITVEVKDDNCGSASASVNIAVTATGGGGNGEGVIIGTAENNCWEPFGGAAAAYKNTQILYHANEIGKAGTINGIATMASTSLSRDFTNLRIYLVTVNRNAIEANIAANYEGQAPILVYQTANLTYGVAATDRDQWHEFNFDNGFAYNGTDNLLVIIERNSTGGGGASVGVYKFDTVGTNRMMAITNQGADTGIPRDYAMHTKLLFE